MTRIIIYCCVLLLTSCQYNPNQEAGEEEVAKAARNARFLLSPFDYYKEYRGDSLFALPILANKDISTFASIPYLVFPYGQQSQFLLEELFLIKNYREMPSFPFFEPINYRSYGIYKQGIENKVAFWLNIRSDTAELVELSTLHYPRKEQYNKRDVVPKNTFVWSYPSQQRQIMMIIELRLDTIADRSKVSSYLDSLHINWLIYLDLVEALNQQVWRGESLSNRLDTFFPQHTHRIEAFYQTAPDPIPIQFEPIRDSLLHAEYYNDHYRKTGAHFFLLDTLRSSTVNIPIEWSVYVQQFIKRERID